MDIEDGKVLEVPVKKKLAYYESDYVKEFTLPETTELPQIKFRYKPMNIVQVANLTEKVVGTKTLGAATEETLRTVATHIVEWDVKDADDNVIDHNKIENLGKIDPTVMNNVAAVIRGDRVDIVGGVKAVQDEAKNLL